MSAAEKAPVRIQQRRTRGWRKPPGAVCVGRGTRWGNPFKHEPAAVLVAKYRSWIVQQPELLADLDELRGKDLMCWCPLGEPCHADVLLELANVVDPWDDTPCEWPQCALHGNPYNDDGWCWHPRYYLWLPDGFFCPRHTVFIEEGKKTGYFKDWPRDMSPEVLERLDEMANWAPLDSDDGQRMIRKVEAAAHRAAFRLVEDE
jgi:hypothetical protein